MPMDQHRHKGQRNKLIRTLIQKGVRDEEVLKAIYKVPRHVFMDSSFEDFAYQDKAFPIAAGQTISQPYTVAFQTMLLEVKKGMKVLEIGTGSGYQAAVLCELGVKLFSIERQKELFDQTRILLRKLKYPAHLKFGDGFAGIPAYAPFDRIIVTCGAPNIPASLLEQLKPGGRMVIPVGQDVQQMKLVTKSADGQIKEGDHGDFRFVPMLRNRNA
mgnify:CR=1 FL=1